MDKIELLKEFCELKLFKTGNFTLKSGEESPIYFDFRAIVSHPKLLSRLADFIHEHMLEEIMEKNGFEYICGVPYTALPIATAISVKNNVKMVLKRREQKQYGTGKMIEGEYKEGDRCVVIEDVATTGSSIIETVECLRKHKIVVTDAVILLDRNQGAVPNCAANNITLHAIFKIDEFVHLSYQHGIVDESTFNVLANYLVCRGMSTSAQSNKYKNEQNEKKPLPEMNKLCCSLNEVNKKIHAVMMKKRSNLIVAVDFNKAEKILAFCDKVGPHVLAVKTHLDMVDDFDEGFLIKLSELKVKHNFLLFEDRKFADIGKTEFAQLTCEHFKIYKYFDLITVHVFPGDGMFCALKKLCGGAYQVGAVLIAEMSCENSRFGVEIKRYCVELAEAYPEIVSGFVCQSRIDVKSDKKSKIDRSGRFVNFTPGVAFIEDDKEKNEKNVGILGQQYKDYTTVIDNGADVIIVGQALSKFTDLDELARKAEHFKQLAFNHLSKVRKI